MDLQTWIGYAQSASITVSFLYLVYCVPNLFKAWLKWSKEKAEMVTEEADKVRKFATEERNADRVVRHEMANAFQKLFSDMSNSQREQTREMAKAIVDLRVASENFCQYRRHHGDAKPFIGDHGHPE